jgi:glutamate-5-semialdehyde dehydrogenase
VIGKALQKNGLSPAVCTVISGESRDITIEMLKQDDFIDIVIPRGSEGLKKTCIEHATMPVLASAGGNCHIYVAKSADIVVAKKIVLNAKTSRPGVCNALETLLLSSDLSDSFIKELLSALHERNVEIRGDSLIKKFFTPVTVIGDDEF